MSRILIFVFLIVFFNSTIANNEIMKTIGDVPKEKWDELLSKKIYFGHQSVGKNIINGIEILQKTYPWLKFNIKEAKELSANNNDSFFAHERIGLNRKPDLKIEAFQSAIQSDILSNTDIAALKFCYVDFEKNTNVLKVFNRYKETIVDIKKSNPDMLVIHFTVPLKTVQSGWKSWVKEIIGKSLEGAEANVLRNEYNNMLVKEFSKEGFVFDIAKYQSTLPDGSRREFKEENKSYYSLAEIYSSDGGHLNELGSKYIAEQFLLFLLSKVDSIKV